MKRNAGSVDAITLDADKALGLLVDCLQEAGKGMVKHNVYLAYLEL